MYNFVFLGIGGRKIMINNVVVFFYLLCGLFLIGWCDMLYVLNYLFVDG